MEIEMEEIIPDEELEIEDVELDVIKEYSGEGTSDYTKLKNKPQINGIELVGDKTTEELGIEVPTKTSELENDSGFITEIPEEYATKEFVNTAIQNALEVVENGTY